MGKAPIATSPRQWLPLHPILDALSASSSPATISNPRADHHGMRLHPANTIRYGELDGLVVVLDLTTQNYFVLNEGATRIWNTILENDGDVVKATEILSALPSAQSGEVASQPNAVISDCLARGFLTTGQLAVAARDGVRPLANGTPHFLGCRAWWILASVSLSLHIRGFTRTYCECAQIRSCGAVAPYASDNLLSKAQAAFLRAENFIWLPGAPDDCLPRSLALFRFLRSLGLPVIHRIGGRRFPAFVMHAWVEYSGKVLLDNQRYAEDYTVIASVPQ